MARLIQIPLSFGNPLRVQRYNAVKIPHFDLHNHRFLWKALSKFHFSSWALFKLPCKNPKYVRLPQMVLSTMSPASSSNSLAFFSSFGRGKNVLNGEECVDSVRYGDKSSHSQQEKKRFIKRGINVDGCGSLVNEEEVEQICSVLRTGDDIETRLEGMGFQLSPGLVKRVLANCPGFEESAERFFLWAKSQRGFDHDSDTYDEMVKIAVRKRDFKFVSHLLAKMKSEGVSALQTFAFLKEDDGIVDEMLQAFIRMKFPEPRDAYDALVFQFCEANRLEFALAAIQGMIRSGYRPIPQIFVVLSDAWCERIRVCRPQEILEQMRKFGYRPDGDTCNFVLKALSAVGKVDDAFALLDSMRLAGCEPDSQSYDILIWGSCEIGDGDGGLQLLHRMIMHEGFTPRQKTYTTIIRALDRVGDCVKAYDMVNFLNDRDYPLSFHNYQSVAEMCYANFERVAAANILIQMIDKGHIPYVELRQKVFHSLVRKGEHELAWRLRRKLMHLRS